MAAVCFEGLGRKLLPWVPGPAFYFLKDAVLLAGLLAFGVRTETFRTARHLMRGFVPVLGVAVVWTVVQVLNPEQPRVEFGLLGLRAYWLWWLAPLVIATALRAERHRRSAMAVLALSSVAVASLAVVQFALPPSHALNQYAPSELEMQVARVATTNRARVTSTFAYITGFTDFVTIVPALLLSVGLAARARWLRRLLLAAVVLAAVSMPMSGSRGPVVLGLLGLATVAYASGLLWTREGRRVIAAGALSVGAALAFSSEAVQGVRDRFMGDVDETRGRFVEAALFVPPLAMVFTDYPTFGLGTGTQQNAAIVLGGTPRYAVEYEQGRVLVEQGAPGYLLLSLARVGLLVALLRAGRLLGQSGRRAEAGAAWALAAFTLPGNLFFDHVFQALFFIGAGIVLEAATRARTGDPDAAGA